MSVEELTTLKGDDAVVDSPGELFILGGSTNIQNRSKNVNLVGTDENGHSSGSVMIEGGKSIASTVGGDSSNNNVDDDDDDDDVVMLGTAFDGEEMTPLITQHPTTILIEDHKTNVSESSSSSGINVVSSISPKKRPLESVTVLYEEEVEGIEGKRIRQL